LNTSICQTATIDFKNYRIHQQIKGDSDFIQMLLPYLDSIQRYKNKVIGFSMSKLVKYQPESGLGNFMADAMLRMAEKKGNKKVDAAVINYGGIRSWLPKGEITIATVYQLVPFENTIVLAEMTGQLLQALLDRAAASGGWPMAGISCSIKDNKAMNVLIKNHPIAPDTTYWIATSDYLAKGGDGCSMLKNNAFQNLGYLYRDALIEYIISITQEGRPISSNIEKRVVYENE